MVTGGRTKIGFFAAVKLLRCGASVIVTSRFPLDTARRFYNHPEFNGSSSSSSSSSSSCDSSSSSGSSSCSSSSSDSSDSSSDSSSSRSSSYDANNNFRCFTPWCDRLHIYGCDFRDIANLERMISYMIGKYPRLDGIVNNAAQTVRRYIYIYII